MQALVEGNYAAPGVNNPLAGSADASDPKRQYHRIFVVYQKKMRGSVLLHKQFLAVDDIYA